MIQRFEDEFPETRIAPAPTDTSTPINPMDELLSDTSLDASVTTIHPAPLSKLAVEDEEDGSLPPIRQASISRRASSSSLASRQAQEEGRMHRFGQRLRRDILRPQMEDQLHGTTGNEEEPEHIQKLRERLENIGSDELKAKVEELGPEATMKVIQSERLRAEAGAGNPDGPEVESLEEWRKRMMGSATIS